MLKHILASMILFSGIAYTAIPDYTAIYQGTNPIQSVYQGNVLIWKLSQPVLSYEIAWFKMDDNASSTTVIDSSVTAYNAANVSVNTDSITVAGKIGTALAFAGEECCITDNATVRAALKSHTFTLSFWVKRLEDSSHAGLFYFRILTGGVQYDVMDYYNTDVGYNFWYFATPPAGYTASGVYTPLPADEWHHFVLIREGYTLTQIIDNGAYTHTCEAQVSELDDFDDVLYLAIGYGPSGITTNTRVIDDFRVYPEALTSSDIAFIYNSGNGTSQPLIK